MVCSRPSPSTKDADKLSRCKGEIRQCVLSNSFDSAIDDEIANWQEACSPYLPSDITTPSVAQPTRTLNGDTCQTFIESCAHLSQSITSCSSAYTKPADITSCRCQSSLVSLASVCNLDGPESCIGTTAAMSDIWELQHCAAATQAFPTSKVRILIPLSCYHGTYHRIEHWSNHEDGGRAYERQCYTYRDPNLWTCGYYKYF